MVVGNVLSGSRRSQLAPCLRITARLTTARAGSSCQRPAPSDQRVKGWGKYHNVRASSTVFDRPYKPMSEITTQLTTARAENSCRLPTASGGSANHPGSRARGTGTAPRRCSAWRAL